MSMNANYLEPLPQVLLSPQTPDRLHRRRQIGNFRLGSLEMDRFNQLLSTLAGNQAHVDCDQVATAARLLVDSCSGQSTPTCIQQRLEQADALSQMLEDRAWAPANDAIAPAGTVLDYLRGQDGLIPDWIPQVGRLDDAIVIDTAWPRLAGEVLSYQDFCRLRLIEAHLHQQETSAFRFDRNDWEVARRAELALREHQRRVRASSYVPTAPGVFRVH